MLKLITGSDSPILYICSGKLKATRHLESGLFNMWNNGILTKLQFSGYDSIISEQQPIIRLWLTGRAIVFESEGGGFNPSQAVTMLMYPGVYC